MLIRRGSLSFLIRGYSVDVCYPIDHPVFNAIIQQDYRLDVYFPVDIEIGNNLNLPTG